MPHTCHAIGCTTSCKPEYLMCYRHWQLVPIELKRNVWRYYRHGQCADKKPSRAWYEAARQAIFAVAFAEGKALANEANFPLSVLNRMIRSRENHHAATSSSGMARAPVHDGR